MSLGKKRFTDNRKLFQVYLVLTLIPMIMAIFPQVLEKLSYVKSYLGPVHDLPMVFLIGVGLLGYKLNQTRVLFTAFMLLGVHFGFTEISEGRLNIADEKIRLSVQGVLLGLPLSLFLALIQKETRLKSLQGGIRLLVSLSPILIFFAISKADWGARVIGYAVYEESWSNLPQMILATYLPLLVAPWLVRDKKIYPYVTALTIATISILFAFQIGLESGVKNSVIGAIVSFLIGSSVLGHAMYKMYEQRVYKDELTGIQNRRALDEYLYTLSGEYTIAMMDIDKFKGFNDNYGHEEGDNALRLVAKTLYESGANVFRYGGEEFCAVFENVDAEDAYMYANKMRKMVQKREFYLRAGTDNLNVSMIEKIAKKADEFKKRKVKPNPQDNIKILGKKVDTFKPIPITISIGLANPTESTKAGYGEEAFEVKNLADRALYMAKDNGRNRVEIFEEPKKSRKTSMKTS